ncbi:MAG: hypothetical protein Q9171_007131 [Xanthocarpia ochracea]
MNALSPSDHPERPKSRSQRSSSIPADRTSCSNASLVCPPAVSPDPAYIAPSSASQIVTGDREPNIEDDDDDGPISPGATNTLVAPNALLLLNAFLDQLLYSFLVSSRSTSIAALRPAVTEVLKPRLAKDAIASADEELREFLGGGDDEELSAFHDGLEPRAGWDLNKIWRRTRLRCMVYTRLGDLEEEDEEMWVERENAGHQADGQHRLSRDLGVVSPAAAIFLTSILEYIGEQVLLLSAEAAYTRFAARQRQDSDALANLVGAQRLSVEVIDIEKLAVNTTFGRLWRSWKKRVRSPSMTQRRPTSHDYFHRPTSSLSANGLRSREPSTGEEAHHYQDYDALPRPTAAEDSNTVLGAAAATPLPMSTYDAREIEGAEFPWQNPGHDKLERPRSVLLSSDSYQLAGQYDDRRAKGPGRGLVQRQRSSSLPTAYGQHPDRQQSLQSAPRDDMFSSGYQTYPPGLSRYESDASAIVTMYDGAIALEEGAMDHNPKYLTNDSPPFYELDETEARNLDRGLDSLTRASIDTDDNTMSPAMLSSEISSRVDNQAQKFPDQSSVRSNQADVSGVSQTQPLGIESQLDSSRMQGHTTENVSLDNRETSIAETKPPRDIVRGFPANTFIQSKDESDDYVPTTLSGPTSYANHDRPNGASYARHGQQNGSTPRSPPETLGPGSSPTFPHAKPSVKLSEIRKQLPPVRTGVERASVQRLSSSPGGTLESPTGRTSTSSSRELRPTTTSGSNTSQPATKPKALGVSRRSSEASNTLATSMVRTPEAEEAQRSFEQLIQSDETIQFTLTPQSVRGTDSPDSPRYSHNRTDTAELADFFRTSGPPPAELGRSSIGRSVSSLKGLNGLRPSSTASSKTSALQTTTPSLEKSKTQNQPSRPNTARSAQGGPRDAQLDTETTRDFADFIRSTGPEKVFGTISTERAVTPSAGKPRPNKAMSPDQRSTSTISTGRKITKSNPSLSRSPPPPVAHNPPSIRTALKLQAREATYEPTHNEDLLDFLKQGPADDRGIEKRPVPGPVASVVPQNPRVPTNLRERLSDNTQSSVASTQNSALTDKSIRSTNSRTGLLDSSRGSLGNSPPLSQRPARFDEPSQVVRKQRRVKDPYAINTDSEDDIQPRTPKPHRQEESLIEFLKSTPPLGEPKPIVPSAFDDIPNPIIRSNKDNKKSPQMYNQRNARTGAAPGIGSANKTQNSNQQPPRGRSTNTAPSAQPPQLPPLNSREISPQIITTFTSSSSSTTVPASSLRNGATTLALTSSTTSSSNTSRKVKPAGTARSDRPEDSRGMGDLADFLRNSEPPTPVPKEVMGRNDGMEEKEGDGKGIWGRIKKRRGR